MSLIVVVATVFVLQVDKKSLFEWIWQIFSE